MANMDDMPTILAKRDDRKGSSEVLFDGQDAKIIEGRNWRVTANGYVYRNAWFLRRCVKIYLHRELLGICASGRRVEVDHKNGNKLDNRRENIRTCSRGLNNANRRKPRAGKSSRYRGVTWAKDKQRWQAQIGFRGKNLLIGRFETEEDAARAYDVEAGKLFGQFARPNFP